MFGLFRKKEKINPLIEPLRFDQKKYADFVYSTFLNPDIDNSTLAHIVVACNNSKILLAVMHGKALKENKTFSVDDLIKVCAESYEKNKNTEINSRRSFWMLMACYLIRLDGISTNDKYAFNICVEIWENLLKSSVFLKELLPNNVVWDDSEKKLFTVSDYDKKHFHIKDDKEFYIRTTLGIIPKLIRKDKRIEIIAEENGIFLF